MAIGPDVPNIEVGERIGGGAFGDVFRGHHRTLQVDVAVKVLNADAVTDVDRALNEARLMARLDHPNLLRIFDAGRTASGLYLVLELMDATCAEHRGLSPDAALDTILQLLGGLQALHDARVLHRDIKPANCLVRQRDGRVKLADLGIAVEQSTRSRQFDFAGTLPFMAPELFEQPPRFSPASDLYALGITMQCLVLESDPYPRGPMSELMAWIHDGTRVNVAHRRPDLPVSLSTLIDRMCARASTERPAVAADAIRALSARTPPTVVRSGDEPTVTLIGSWVLGTEIPGDANFRQHAVTHVRTGAAGRLAVL